MSGIVQIQIGQCGNQVGSSYWKKIADEHRIATNGSYVGEKKDEGLYLAKSELMFNYNNTEKKYVPRAILIDSECSVLDEIRQSELGKLFKPTNIIHDKRGTGGVWAAGRHGLDSKFLSTIHEAIRKEAESCDLIGFQFVNSLGGGTGSGLTSLLMEYVHTNFPGKLINTFNVVPSPIQNGTVLDYYNATLTMPRLINYSKGCFFFDNQALRHTCRNILKSPVVKIEDTNDLIARTMSGLSSCQRFPSSESNLSIKSVQEHLNCSKNAHFYVPNLSFSSCSDLNSLYKDMNGSGPNSLLSIQNDASKVVSFASILRGNLKEKVDSSVLSKNIKWFPNNGLVGLSSMSESNKPISALTISNTKAIEDFLQRLMDRTNKMYMTRAFVHNYIAEMMEESEFSEAIEMCHQLKTDYQNQTVKISNVPSSSNNKAAQPVNNNVVQPANNNAAQPANTSVVKPENKNVVQPANNNAAQPANNNSAKPTDANNIKTENKNVVQPANNNAAQSANNNSAKPTDTNNTKTENKNAAQPPKSNVVHPASNNTVPNSTPQSSNKSSCCLIV